jgi:hypothetical protein
MAPSCRYGENDVSVRSRLPRSVEGREASRREGGPRPGTPFVPAGSGPVGRLDQIALAHPHLTPYSVTIEAYLAATDRSRDCSGWNVGKTVAQYTVETAVCIVRRDVKLNHGCSVDRERSLDKGLLH